MKFLSEHYIEATVITFEDWIIKTNEHIIIACLNTDPFPSTRLLFIKENQVCQIADLEYPISSLLCIDNFGTLVSHRDELLDIQNEQPVYQIPRETISTMEEACWISFQNNQLDADTLVARLKELHMQTNVSPLSVALLEAAYTDQMDSCLAYAMDKFERSNQDLVQLISLDNIIAASIAPRNVLGDQSIVVICTENQHIYVIQLGNFKNLFQSQVSAPVVHLKTAGCFELNFKIILSTRKNEVYMINQSSSKCISHFEAPIVGLQATDDYFVVGLVDKWYYCVDFKGNRLYSCKLENRIVSLSIVDVQPHIPIVLVATEKQIYAYVNGIRPLESLKNNEDFKSISCIKAIATKSQIELVITSQGRITIQRFDFTQISPIYGYSPPKEQETPISIPKKTSRFIETYNKEDSASRLDELTKLMNLVDKNGITKVRKQALKVEIYESELVYSSCLTYFSVVLIVDTSIHQVRAVYLDWFGCSWNQLSNTNSKARYSSDILL